MSTQVMSWGTTGPGVRPAMSERGRFAAILDLENVAIKDDGRVTQTEMRTPKIGMRMIQDNAGPVLGGLAIIGVGLAVLLQSPAVRDACRRILQDPDITEACREVVARVIARSSHPDVSTA